MLRLNVLYRGIAKCAVGDGSTVTFWEDLWSDEIMATKFPVLFSFVRNNNSSVQELLNAEDLDSILHLPLSSQAMEELLILQQELVTIPYNADQKDTWSLIWGSPIYTSRRYYKMVFQYLQVSPIFKKLWSSKCTQRIKFFAWLMLVDRLNTKMMLLRRNFHVQPNTFCVMCSSSTHEDIDHLFFYCPFAARCWQRLGIQWADENDIYDRILLTASSTGIPFFMEVFLIASWEI